MDKDINFESCLGRLETIVKKLEEEELTLEESISLYEEGIKLAKKCNEILDNVELKILQLSKEENSKEKN